MRQEYEQLELDTRKDLDRAISKVTSDAIRDAEEMIRESAVAPTPVRNRHEAYGIAAEHYSATLGKVKRIGKDVDTLLGALSDPNYPALEATSSIVNSTVEAAATIIKAAAEMRRTLDNLYMAETYNKDSEAPPMFAPGADAAMFQEAEPAEAEPEEEADQSDSPEDFTGEDFETEE